MDVEEEGLPGGDTKEPSGRKGERESERREKKDGARMGKRILFLVGGSSECLSSSLPLSLSFFPSFIRFHIFHVFLVHLHHLRSKGHLGYMQSANTLTSVTDAN